MSNLPDPQHVDRMRSAFRPEQLARMEDYLDHLCAPLVGILPYEERMSLRHEMLTHLDGLIEEYAWEGLPISEAMDLALREFGEPWQIGESIVREWSTRCPERAPRRIRIQNTLRAFAYFGIASLLNLFLIDLYTLELLSPSAIYGIVLLMVVSPIVAGGLTGVIGQIPSREAIRNAVLILALHSLATGMVLLPHREGLLFGGLQWLYWLPVGKACAGWHATYRQRRRREHFWSVAHSSISHTTKVYQA